MPSYGKVLEPPHGPSEDAGPSTVESGPRSDYDEWEMEERLRHLDRIYARSPLSGPLSSSTSPQFRIDSMHRSVPRNRPVAAPPAEPRLSGLARFGRVVLGLGLAVTVCGGCLMAWGNYGARPDLLPMGIPIAVAGQILLLAGLVLQLDSPTSAPRPAAKSVRSRRRDITGDANLRFDSIPDATRQLTALAARLDELSRKFEDREERSQ